MKKLKHIVTTLMMSFMWVTYVFSQDTLIENIKYPIELKHYSTSIPNSAGGVDCNIKFKNNSNKIIKYITFTVSGVNSVNDLVIGKFNDSKMVKVRGVGPLNPNKNSRFNWGCLWYNPTIDHLKIFRIEIEFMDGEIFDTLKCVSPIEDKILNILINGNFW